MTPVLETVGLSKSFDLRGGIGQPARRVHAVSGVDLALLQGQTLGIVGESGCGKSTTARLIMGLMPADTGDILLDGRAVAPGAAAMRAFRRNVQMVFQDSSASLNPRLTLEQSVAFGPQVHGLPNRDAVARARDLLARVGLDPARFAGRYPHEVSGGEAIWPVFTMTGRQRSSLIRMGWRRLALPPKRAIRPA
jgi:peptide/nickel transport system ATP-binding protein